MTDLERDPIPILYVLSNGRSGSTLLDLLLGTHPEVFTLGEVQILPHELREHREPCGCGTPVDACEFWEPLVSSPDLEALAHFREHHGFGRVVRPGHLVDRWRGGPRGERAEQAEGFARANARVLRRIWQRASEVRGRTVEWLVDASKDPYRLEWLRRDPEFDLRVVHLYKQPGSFVHSMRRGESGVGPLGTLRQTLRWRVENGLMHRLFRSLPGERSLLVPYELLATRPRHVLDHVADICDLDPEGFSIEDFRREGQHGVAGNVARWNSDGIRLDEAWRQELPVGYRLAAQALCGGLAKRLDERARRAA